MYDYILYIIKIFIKNCYEIVDCKNQITYYNTYRFLHKKLIKG